MKQKLVPEVLCCFKKNKEHLPLVFRLVVGGPQEEGGDGLTDNEINVIRGRKKGIKY